MRVRLVWDSRPGLKVPVTAVSRQAGKTFVYVIETDTTEGTTKTIAKQKKDRGRKDYSKSAGSSIGSTAQGDGGCIRNSVFEGWCRSKDTKG